MKTTLRLAALLATGALALAGCGGGSKSSGSGSGPVHLTVWTGFSGPDRPAYEALISQFNATHPDIQVSMDVQPWDTISQKLPAAWATGQGPDLATPNFDPGVIYQYIKTGSVLPLDGKLDASAFPQSVTKAFTVDGKLYAAPANLASVVLYYNKAMFAAAGITDAPKTQDELVADAQKLTLGGATPSQFGISLADHATIQMWPILEWADGGDIVDGNGCATVNSAASVSALQTWADLVANKHVSPVGQTGADADTLFSAKKAAMELNGPWAADGFRKAGIDLGIAAVPVGSAGPVTLASTVPLMVAKSSKHQTQALEFLNYWTSKDAQAAFSKSSGFPPSRTDVTVADPNIAVFASALPSSRLYLSGIQQSSQIDSDVYTQLIGKITRGSAVQGAADDAAKAINAITGCKA